MRFNFVRAVQAITLAVRTEALPWGIVLYSKSFLTAREKSISHFVLLVAEQKTYGSMS